MSDAESALPNALAAASDDDALRTRSIVERVRAKHEHVVKHRDLFPPRWDGDVAVRCGRAGASRKALSKIGGTPTAQAARLLTLACQEILVRDEDGSLISIAEQGDPAVRFDDRLAELFGLPPGNPTRMCMALYGDDVALIAQAEDLFEWRTGKSLAPLNPDDLDDLEDELGEATAAS